MRLEFSKPENALELEFTPLEFETIDFVHDEANIV